MKSEKTAIFIHGGAIKGAFGAGVIYGLSRMGVKTADVVVGVSSGAATAAYFTSKQIDIIKQVWTKEIATDKFVTYSGVLAGRPAFNLDYLIKTLFQKEYPLNVSAVLDSETELRIPLCRYPDEQTEFFSSRGEKMHSDFWNIFHAAITMHDKHILWGSPWESYVDADLDPFALYRQEIVPRDWNVLVVGNHHEMGNTMRKWLGLQIFLLIQARHFPRAAKEMLQKRVALIRSGVECFDKFKQNYNPLVILPSAEISLKPASVIQRNNDKLTLLFKAGEKTALQNQSSVSPFLQRSAELLRTETPGAAVRVTPSPSVSRSVR